MGRSVVYLIELTGVPESCLKCPIASCHLPVMRKRPDTIKKAYLNKRHSQCPLYLVDPENLELVGRNT